MIYLDRIVSEELTRGNGDTIIWDKVFCIVIDKGISIHGDTDIGNDLSVYQFRYRNMSLVTMLTAIPLEMIFENPSYLMLQVRTDVWLMGKRIVDHLVVTAVSVLLQFIDAWPAIGKSGKSVTLTNTLIDRFDEQAITVTHAIKLTRTICQVENAVEWFQIIETASGIVDTSILVIAY